MSIQVPEDYVIVNGVKLLGMWSYDGYEKVQVVDNSINAAAAD